ncbi:MAG: aminotransferase class III-fold pyridoxal phosphate-dependent enzyme [Candidatus Riflebacteria bacterium]|nr:aminotransferase class III-fold pyridoxal phosphate-dependent enzyme [Candidatus Riflebacteria bacterium]
MTHEVGSFLEGGSFRYAQSHQNDPLGCSTAMEVIRLMRSEKLVERSKVVGAKFMEELRRLAKKHDQIKEVRGRGLMIALEFDKNFPPSIDTLNSQLLNRGFVVGMSSPASLLRFLPPFTIGEQDIIQLIENLDQILL